MFGSEYIPDYNDLHREYEARQERELERLPRCSECDEPITDDECYEINGELVCPCCLKENYRKRTEDYVE